MSNKNLADILKDIKNTTSQYNNLGGYKTCDSGCKLSLIKGGPLMLGGGNYLEGNWKDWRKTFDSSNSNSYKIQLALFDVPKFNYSVRYVDLPFRFEDWHAAHNYAKEQFGGLKFQVMGSRDAAHWHKSGLDKKEEGRSFEKDVKKLYLDPKENKEQSGGSGLYNLLDSKEIIRNSNDMKDLTNIYNKFNQFKLKKNSRKIKKLN